MEPYFQLTTNKPCNCHNNNNLQGTISEFLGIDETVQSAAENFKADVNIQIDITSALILAGSVGLGVLVGVAASKKLK